jgi:tetratricopeptide (TPR) repeat protein
MDVMSSSSRSRLRRVAILAGLVLLGLSSGAFADKNNTFYVSTTGRFYGESVAYLKRGTDCLARGDLNGARQSFDVAIRIDKKIWPAYLDRAIVYQQQGNLKQALADVNEAARLKPQFFRTFIARASIYGSLGRCAEAIADLDRVISFHANPEMDAVALNLRAALRANCQKTSVHDPKRALEDAKKACDLDGWHMANYLGTLAVAYAANGDFASAIRYQKQAIDSGRYLPDELKHAQARLAAYQKHQGH